MQKATQDAWDINRKTSQKITWVQFIASIFVVLDHSFNYIQFVPSTQLEVFLCILLDKVRIGMTHIVMPSFFAISGFLLFKSAPKSEGVNCFGWYIDKLKSRALSLLLPFLLWNIIWSIFFMTLGALGMTSGNVDTTLTLPNVFAGIFKNKYNEVFWYMRVLIIYVLVSPVFYLLLKNKWCGYIWLIISVFLTLFIFPSTPVRAFSNFHNFFFYMVGCFIALHHPNMINLSYRKKSIWVSLIVLLIASILLRLGQMQHPGLLFINRVIGFVAYWVCMDIFRSVNVKSFARYSFFIYATHKPIQQTFNKIFTKILQPNIAGHIINVYGGAALTLLVIAFLAIVMKRVIPKCFALLNGGRAK